MELSATNYYSQDANLEYMSVSQFKDFAGTYGKMGCEFTAIKKLTGEWNPEKTTNGNADFLQKNIPDCL